MKYLQRFCFLLCVMAGCNVIVNFYPTTPAIIFYITTIITLCYWLTQRKNNIDCSKTNPKHKDLGSDLLEFPKELITSCTYPPFPKKAGSYKIPDSENLDIYKIPPSENPKPPKISAELNLLMSKCGQPENTNKLN